MRHILFAIFISSLAVLPACRADTETQAVKVGQEAGFDACSGVGRVAINSADGGDIDLKDAPSNDAKITDTLQDGDVLWLCEEKGEWFGVVVDESAVDCGVSSPVSAPMDYKGPCKSGWVIGKNVVPIAG